MHDNYTMIELHFAFLTWDCGFHLGSALRLDVTMPKLFCTTHTF